MFIISATINKISCTLDLNWILLGNQSTIELFCNIDLLIHIHEVDADFLFIVTQESC